MSRRKKTNPKTLRVFAAGYNYYYQFGVNKNENYTEELQELEWTRGRGIDSISGSVYFNCYLSSYGDYYFSGIIDTALIGITLTKKTIIKKKSATSIQYFLSSEDKKKLDQFNVLKVSHGISSSHTIIINQNNKAFGVGSNIKGQLGINSNESTLKFKKVLFPKIKINNGSNGYLTDLNVLDIACGLNHSAFICTPKPLPTELIINYWVRQAYYNKEENIIDANHLIPSIKIIIKKYIIKYSKGLLYTCGDNQYGQLGLGSHIKQVNKPTFVKHLENYSIEQVECGEFHTIVLDKKGIIYTFGDNYYGQSGAHQNHYENCFIPQRVRSLADANIKITKISSGKYHCCALSDLNDIFCWGLGAYGQLGQNKLIKRNIVPTKVYNMENLPRMIDIKCGTYHTVALSNKFELYCWGYNNYGQCFQSINDYEMIVKPMKANLKFNLPIYKVFAGYYSTLIIFIDNNVNYEINGCSKHNKNNDIDNDNDNQNDDYHNNNNNNNNNDQEHEKDNNNNDNAVVKKINAHK